MLRFHDASLMMTFVYALNLIDILLYLFIFYSQLTETVNCLSSQGQLPLGIALVSRSTAIAQTLVQNGKADVNAYNGDVSIEQIHVIIIKLNWFLFSFYNFQGCTLLIDAIQRGDGFSAQFLLEQGCNVNLTSRITSDTALHLICTYSEKSSEGDTYGDMISVGKSLLEHKADPNLQNIRG